MNPEYKLGTMIKIIDSNNKTLIGEPALILRLSHSGYYKILLLKDLSEQEWTPKWFELYV